MDELELGRIIERIERRISDHEIQPHTAIDHVHDMGALDALSNSVAPLLQQAAEAAATAEALAAEAAISADNADDADAAEAIAENAGDVADEADEAAADAAPARVHPLGRTLSG